MALLGQNNIGFQRKKSIEDKGHIIISKGGQILTRNRRFRRKK